MEAVAQEADVSKALVHYYFATRRELIRAAFLYSEDRANAVLEAELALSESGAGRLERFLVLDLDAEPVYRESRALWSEAWSLMRHDELLRPEVERLYRAWTARLGELVEDARRDGSLPQSVDAEALTRRLAALVDGLESQLLLGVTTFDESAQTVRETIAEAVARAPDRRLRTTAKGA
jgi:AcrR family transcriptional regulator